MASFTSAAADECERLRVPRSAVPPPPGRTAPRVVGQCYMTNENRISGLGGRQGVLQYIEDGGIQAERRGRALERAIRASDACVILDLTLSRLRVTRDFVPPKRALQRQTSWIRRAVLRLALRRSPPPPSRASVLCYPALCDVHSVLHSHQKKRGARTLLELDPRVSMARNNLQPSHVRPQNLRHENAPVFHLVVFEDGNERTSNRQPAAVNGVAQLRLRLGSSGAVAERHAAGLEVAHVAAARDFTPRLLPGHPDLEVAVEGVRCGGGRRKGQQEASSATRTSSAARSERQLTGRYEQLAARSSQLAARSLQLAACSLQCSTSSAFSATCEQRARFHERHEISCRSRSHRAPLTSSAGCRSQYPRCTI